MRRTLTLAAVGLLACLLANCGGGGGASANAPATRTWIDAGIGTPAQAGSHAWDGTTLTVTGVGAGLDEQGGDQNHFTYVTGAAGDFEVVARLVALSGPSDCATGIMVRAGHARDGFMSALIFTAKDNALGFKTRVPDPARAEKTRVVSGGIPLARRPPMWIRLVRMGGNFAVYRSADGQLWSMISNVSGGPCAFAGAVDLGFFVSGAAPGAVTVATFDSIRIGPAAMRYQTSWVGNTFGSRDEDSHVSNGLSAMWVAPDGTCYTSCYWDEGGQPVTSYRNGRVARPLPIGTPQTAEGAITGDAKKIYVAFENRIIACDPAQADFAPTPLPLATDLLDRQAHQSVVGGLASDEQHLFIGDARANVVRVASLTPLVSYHIAWAANDGTALAPAPIVVPGNDPRMAPALIYQTQRVGEGCRYTIPGFTPGEAFTLRCHFAEYVDRSASTDPRSRFRTIDQEQIDVVALAGGILKPVVVDIPGYVANAKGEVVMNTAAYGGPGICGFEILSAGVRRFAINCGGPAIGDFKSESVELIDRAFAFDRPGPMTIDRRGDLWIIQRGCDLPIGFQAAKYPAAVRCYRAAGTFTGRVISDVVNPRALGYDAAKDQLLVAENGPELNLRFYGGLATTPTLARTFGQKGGIYGGTRPGVVNDHAAGGYARFAGIAGVGVDAVGNLYVGGGLQGTDLRMFAADGTVGWMLNSHIFCNTYDVDLISDGSDVFSTYNHLKIDLSPTGTGRTPEYIGYNWDIPRFGQPPGVATRRRSSAGWGRTGNDSCSPPVRGRSATSTSIVTKARSSFPPAAPAITAMSCGATATVTVSNGLKNSRG